ncbi:hypothetical protein EVAR_54639_1 [Eumeta japonica]|uniref:Uncharacterized protein n=1 Tax=Eumeta variegata TaxID=151549 RepID=A0A4C1XA16_EUMVA|nr:hypothetical protein EVAR_54639_1 [Eumeta japonica]
MHLHIRPFIASFIKFIHTHHTGIQCDVRSPRRDGSAVRAARAGALAARYVAEGGETVSLSITTFAYYVKWQAPGGARPGCANGPARRGRLQRYCIKTANDTRVRFQFDCEVLAFRAEHVKHGVPDVQRAFENTFPMKTMRRNETPANESREGRSDVRGQRRKHYVQTNLEAQAAQAKRAACTCRAPPAADLHRAHALARRPPENKAPPAAAFFAGISIEFSICSNAAALTFIPHELARGGRCCAV